MRLIKPSVELLKQDYTLDGIYKQIELAGRTSYKSFNKITPDSAKEFVDRLIKSGHLSVLEHGTVYLKLENVFLDLNDHCINPINRLVNYYIKNPYSRVVITDNDDDGFKSNVYITTNYRVLVENNWMGDLKYICEPTEFHEKRIAVRFVCDRGVSHEFVRHRVFSFAQESTRYCNYSKDKFGNQLTFIEPVWYDSLSITHRQDFEIALERCEDDYLEFIRQGWTPQQARQVLSNALKTELVMTGFESDWDHFFELRCSNAAHPDARYLANMCKDLIKNNNNDRNS